MKKILFLAALCLPLLFAGCEGRVINTTVTIYGTVYDRETFDPIQGAMVKIQPGQRDRTTGSDGAFQFDDLDLSDVVQYTLYVSKEGYVSDSKAVILNAGESSNVSFALKKK